MAERKITTNTFGEGLIMDFAPDNTPNTSLSNALNATLLTYNGNEMSLQNDMGNGRVESAYLPEGYIPVGVCEFGDIIYIASYNPLINKSQIGCFPSPERNISNKEISDLNTTFSSDELAKDGTIVNSNIKKIIFGNKNIGPGDKFIISWGQAGLNNKNFISNFGNTLQSFAEGESYWPKLVKLHIVSIQDDGKLIYLDNDVQWYPTNIKDSNSNSDNAFPISTEEFLDEDGTMKDLHNLDEYRHALNCQYSVFQQKVSGKLGILLELESINNFNCGHKIFRRKYKIKEGDEEKEEEVFDIYFSASWDTDNYNINPSGIIITKSTLKNMSLVSNEGSGENITHYKDYLQVPKEGEGERDRDRMIEFTRLYKLEEPGNTYAKFKEKSYYTQVKNYLSFKVPGSIEYKDIPELSTDLSSLRTESATPAPGKKSSKALTNNTDNPNIEKPLRTIYKYRPLIKNLLRAYVVKDNCKVPMTITKEYEETKENKKIKKFITLGAYYCNPEEINDDGQYTTTINGIKIPLSPEGIPDDVVVNTFKRPVLVKVATVKKKELDENIKDAEYYINYTVCPCMPYGVLDHLAISNTIDFNKNQDGSVNLDTWKYYVNADSITLNYGLTTNLKEDENEVVEKVVMEFYDNQGLSASYEIKNQDTFDAKFTEYIELDKESSNYKILNTRIPENSISRELTELIPHAGEYAGQCVKDIIDDDHEKYVYFDKNQKVRSATDLFDENKDPNIATDILEDPEIPKDNPTEISEGEEEYHASYTLVKTTSECHKSISYSLKHEEDVNTLENIAYIKGNIFKGVGFTQYKKEVFKVSGDSIKWIGETIPEGTKYYFILGKHGETTYTSSEFKTFMGFDASKLDFIIVYYYNLAGGVNLYYTTVTQSGVETKCPIIIVNSSSSLKGEEKSITFSVSTENKDDIKLKIAEEVITGKEINYTIKNVKKGDIYNAIASVTTEEWTTSIFFYFTVYTTTSNPVISKPDPVKITFGKEVINSTARIVVIDDDKINEHLEGNFPQEYNNPSISVDSIAWCYDLQQENGVLSLQKASNVQCNNLYYQIVDSKEIDNRGFVDVYWKPLDYKIEVANLENPRELYLGIFEEPNTKDAVEIKAAAYKITVEDSKKPSFTWEGTCLNNGDVQLTITPDTDITYASMSISPLVTNERINKDGSLIYTLKNPSIGKYTGTIYLKTQGYNIKNTFSFEIKSNSQGGSDQPSGIPIIKWQYPSKTFTGEKFIKFGVNKNNCNEYLTTLIIEDPSGIHTENLGKEFHGEKSVKISKHSNISDDKIDFTKVTISITDYNGKILNSDSRKYVISLADVPVYPNNAGILYYGRPYYVLIKIFKARLDELGNFDRENYEFPIIYQRWLWTAPIFNDKYTTYSDFKDCQFQTGLDFIGYLNGKKLIDQISSKILLPKCLMDNYPKDSEFKVIDSIGANVNIVGSQTDPNITFTGVPDVADSYGNSIFLSNESYNDISVSIGLGNKRVLIDDTKIQLQDSDEEYSLPQILPDSGNPDSSVLEDSDPILGKDNFNLELLFKGYTPIKTIESYRYYDSTGLNIREGTFDMYTIPLQNWLPTNENMTKCPLLRLYGIKYNKMAARERVLLDSYKQIRPIIEKIEDLEQYGLSIDGDGKPYYDKIPFLGFSEKEGGGTQTHLTCGYLEYTSANDDNPRLYVKFYDKIDGNPFKGSFQHKELSKFLENISTSLVQQVIVGRGCRIGGKFNIGSIGYEGNDGVDGDSILSPCPYRLTQRMGRDIRQDRENADRIMGWEKDDKDYFPYPYNLVEVNIDPNKTPYSSSIEKYNHNVNPERSGETNVSSELATYPGRAAFRARRKPKREYGGFYTYTLLGIQDAVNGFIGTADGGILKFVYKEGYCNLPQNFAWSIQASAVNKKTVRNYAQIIASLLSQIYVLSDTEKDHYILQNLVKLNKYKEAWRADILVKLHCNTEGKNSSKFINIIPKQFTQGGHTYVGINLFAFAAAAQYSALHPVDNEGNKISLESYVNSETFKFTDENNINPVFSDLVKCIEFSYDLPYDLGDLETQCYNSNFASQNFLQNIYTEESGVSYKQIPVSQTLNTDQLYVFNGGKFIPFNHGSNIYLIDKFVNPSNQGILFGIVSKYDKNLVKLELNRSSNIHEALTYDGARLVFKDITKLQGYDSKYTWILRTHGDDPELRDLANINLFNYGKLV